MAYQGNGYVTEGVNTVIDFAFNELKAQKLVVLCDSENTKSIGVAERCGFILEVEALGILDHPGNGELRLGRRYAKYN
jgi:RimJ/RimL family protein N-acetyltransferase